MNKIIFLHRLFKAKNLKRKKYQEEKTILIPEVLSNAITTYGMLEGGKLKVAV
jgi:hypothetical protein